MPSERLQRQIEALLEEADEASRQGNWTVVRDRADAVLAFDPENADVIGLHSGS